MINHEALSQSIVEEKRADFLGVLNSVSFLWIREVFPVSSVSLKINFLGSVDASIINLFPDFLLKS